MSFFRSDARPGFYQRNLFLQWTLFLSICIASLSVSKEVSAQGLLDGVRLGRALLPTGSRGTAMGGAMVSAVNDYTALDWNPAALAPLEFDEFGLGISERQHSSDAVFLGNTLSDQLSSTDFSSIGATFAAPVKRGHFAFGISFDRARDYTNTYSFSAINPASSYLGTQQFISDPGIAGQTIGDYKGFLDQNNPAWSLYLTKDIDSLHSKLVNPFAGGLLQSGTVTEGGGMNALRVGGGIDIAPGVAVGATINFFFGDYTYTKVYSER